MEQKILTRMLDKVVHARCKFHSGCLCQYIDSSFDDDQKHPCWKGDPHRPQRIIHVFDDFVKSPKSEFIPLLKKKWKKSPLHIEFHYRPHIQQLHVVGGFPYFHRRSHRKKYQIPWYKYARYEHLRPGERPKWLPKWMWNEIGAHTHHDPRKIGPILRDAGYGTPQLAPNTKAIVFPSKKKGQFGQTQFIHRYSPIRPPIRPRFGAKVDI